MDFSHHRLKAVAAGEHRHDHPEVVEAHVVGGPPLAVAVHLLVVLGLDGEGLDNVVRVGEGPGPEEEELAGEDGRRHPVLEADLHVHEGRV
eukprot:129283-Hanusia_phi.AAC.1